MASEYAWIIDKDHLSGPGGEFYNAEEPDHGEGVIGPSACEHHHQFGMYYEDNKAELTRNYDNHHQFRMYDDDDILYYTGTLFWNGPADHLEEEQAYGPLGDYGMPSAGAVLIKYTDKPEWDCG